MIDIFLEYQMFVAECHEYGVPAPPPPMGFNLPGGVMVSRDPRIAKPNPRRAGLRLRCVATLPKKGSKPPPGPYYERPE